MGFVCLDITDSFDGSSGFDAVFIECDRGCLSCKVVDVGRQCCEVVYGEYRRAVMFLIVFVVCIRTVDVVVGVGRCVSTAVWAECGTAGYILRCE